MEPSAVSTTLLPIRWTALAAMGIALLLLSAHTLSQTAPASSWLAILAGRPPDPVSGLIFGQAALPRLVMSWLLGAALGLAGLIFQQALRNPLADPAMIGVSSGAYLALATAVLYVPGLLAWGLEAVALAGGAAACALVMIVAWRARFSVIHVILAGLIVSLLCGAAGAVLSLMNHELLSGLFIWQSGSLVQNGWQGVRRLAPQVIVLAICVVSLRRPLAMLSLDDARAMSLGVRVSVMRFVAMALGVILSAISVAGAGVIGFIGLMAPNLGRMLGARTFGQNLMLSPLVGALLLWAADQAVQVAGPFAGQVPAGSACALVGAPLLFWLLLGRRIVSAERPASGGSVVLRRRPASLRLVALFFLACIVCAAVALLLGRTPSGWAWSWGSGWPLVRDWRLPRVMAAGVAGAMLAMAGSLLQRLTGNALASPEVLGVSAGASLGVVGMLLLANSLHPAGLLAASGLGALISLIVILALNWRSGFAPQRLLLAGVALSTLSTACAAYLLSSGDPRAFMLLTWMSGSTYHATMAAVWPGVFLLAASLSLSVAARRWLAILPLAEPSARSLGVRVAAARLYFLVIIAAATAGATVLVGPLTFAGLLAPHLVRGLGLRRPGPDLAGSALSGATLMILADWVGRVVTFPWQVPAGLVAMMIGGPFFLWLLWRRNDCA